MFMNTLECTAQNCKQVGIAESDWSARSILGLLGRNTQVSSPGEVDEPLFYLAATLSRQKYFHTPKTTLSSSSLEHFTVACQVLKCESERELACRDGS
jgi:hypothetical protein